MRKFLILTFLVLFITGCSNIDNKKNESSEVERMALINLIAEIKEQLQIGDVTKLKSTLEPNLRNLVLERELQNIDFSKVNILSSKPVFKGDTAENITAFNVQSTTVYFDVVFVLKNGEWKIVKFKERRG